MASVQVFDYHSGHVGRGLSAVAIKSRIPDRKTPSHLFEGVIGLRDHLRVSYAPEWHPAYEQEGGVSAVGFTDYPDWLWEGMWDGRKPSENTARTH